MLRSAQPSRVDLDSGAGVIVQAAYDEWVFHVRHTQEAEEPLDFIEVRAAGVVEVFRDAWCTRRNLVASGVFALQDPQRVRLQPPPAIFTELVAVRPEIFP